MLKRRPFRNLRSLILPLALLPVLIGCHNDGPPPLSKAALSAVGERPGAPREALARAIDSLFTAPGIGETRALVVFHNGRIVAERYAEGYGPQTRFLGWSMTKSVTGALIGLLVADGRLRLDQPVPIPAWQRPGDPRGEVTLRQLLQMRSGLRNTEEADPVADSDTVRMLFLDGRDDMAAYAETQPLEAPPGRKFEYSTPTSVILADAATRALTDSRDPPTRRRLLGEYLKTRLTEPLGMASAVPEFDAGGTFIGGSMMHATARDWGRFGEFLRNMGSVKGAQVVPRDWIAFMTTPSPANPGYGAQVWLNRRGSIGVNGQPRDELFPGRAPHSLFAAIGHFGQYVLVSPEQHLTVVRLGRTVGEDRAALRSRLADLVELFPRDGDQE
ncbi:MAG: beta-lactamase family protein [Sphingomonadales bacterium]|nr:beta-lactamase family protein [Sphingomonadales bacterium]